MNYARLSSSSFIAKSVAVVFFLLFNLNRFTQLTFSTRDNLHRDEVRCEWKRERMSKSKTKEMNVYVACVLIKLMNEL